MPEPQDEVEISVTRLFHKPHVLTANVTSDRIQLRSMTRTLPEEKIHQFCSEHAKWVSDWFKANDLDTE